MTDYLIVRRTSGGGTLRGADDSFISAPMKDPGFAKEGDHSERAARAYKVDLRVKTLTETRGSTPRSHPSAPGRVPLKLKAF